MRIRILPEFLCLLYVHSCLGDDWIIIEDIGLEHEYSEAVLSANVLAEVTTSSIEIPRAASPKDLEICFKLRNAKIYVRTPHMTKFPEPENFEKMAQTSAQVPEGDVLYKLKAFRTFVGDIGGHVYAFPCQTHANRVYWMAYNYTAEHRIFLLRDVDDRGLIFVGQAERIPTIRDEYRQGNALDEYFRKTYLSTPRLAAEGINPFACSSLLRLCCLVHAARTSQSFTMNYANGVLGSVYNEYKVVFGKPRLSESLSPPVVGCVVNRESVHGEHFYLRSHPDRPDTVFVFGDVGESGKYEITPTQLVSDLHFACQYATHFI